MPRFHVIEPAAYQRMPWRNGQGMTTEIAIADGPGGRFRWRLSIADVTQSGPFSNFAGYERIIAVVAGNGMRLDVAGCAPVVLDGASDPHAFPGEAATSCTLLDGPIRDFNLICDRDACRGTLDALRFADAPLRRQFAGGTAFLHALRGALEVDDRDGWQDTVAEEATLRIEDFHGVLTVKGASGSHALLAAIAPRLSDTQEEPGR
jgi:environmental stress-induced protein Ves